MTLKRINHGTNHRYKLDGKTVQGVTTIMGKTIPKPALVHWAAKVVAARVADADDDDIAAWRRLGRDPMVAALAALPSQTTTEAGVRGTHVHRYAEALCRGETIVENDDNAPVWGHIEQCAKFLDQWRVAPVVTEAVIGSRRYGYAGTLDLIADLPDGRRGLFDYKTGKKVYGETALQLAAYRYADFFLGDGGAEVPMRELGIDCTYVVRIDSSGYEVIPVDTGKDEESSEAFRMFRTCIELARAIDNMPNWVGEVEQWLPIER